MQGMTMFHNYHCGQVTAIIWFKNCMLILLSPPNDYSGNIEGQNQEFLTLDMIKLYFEEDCIWYNYKLLCA
jgi:hypothetical protein